MILLCQSSSFLCSVCVVYIDSRQIVTQDLAVKKFLSVKNESQMSFFIVFFPPTRLKNFE